MDSFEIKNRELSDVLLKSDTKNAEVLLNYLNNKFSLSENFQKIVEKKILQFFLPTFKKKFKESLSMENRFLQKNEVWLEGKFSVSGTSLSKNRKTKLFVDCSDKTKYRRMNVAKSAVLNDNVNKMEEVEKDCLIHVIKDTERRKSSEEQISKKDELLTNNPSSFSDDEALSLFMDLKLTKNTYEILRKRLKDKQHDILPSYKNIAKSKTECYPPDSAIEINANGANLKLQGLLDHTANRILKIESVAPPENKNLKLKVKYGCDGTSGMIPYKYQSEKNENLSSSSLFLMSMVPLSLESRDESVTFWKNSRTSSPKSCLPISFQFIPETKETILNEVKNINKQIKRLKTGKIEVNGNTYNVEYELMCTMIDGKVCQIITETSSSATCTICGAKPSEMNNLLEVKMKEENVDAFQFGLQTLHAWIRCMECILHIAYRLDFKQWQAKTPEQKASCKTKKQYIQTELRKRIGIIVDVTRQGTGSSNDGNTARKFFENYKIVAEVTGINEDLIKNLYIILQVLACDQKIDTDKFSKFASTTAEIYEKSYSWYYMPASVHKILVHGAQIIASFIIPIGQLSEEAQESRNKDFKRAREANTRKFSLITINEDLLHFLLVSADPYLNSLRNEFPIKKKPLLIEAQELLLNTESDFSQETTTSQSTDK